MLVLYMIPTQLLPFVYYFFAFTVILAGRTCEMRQGERRSCPCAYVLPAAISISSKFDNCIMVTIRESNWAFETTILQSHAQFTLQTFVVRKDFGKCELCHQSK